LQILSADIPTKLDGDTFHTNTSRHHNYFQPPLVAAVYSSPLVPLFLFQLDDCGNHHLKFFADLVSSHPFSEYDDKDEHMPPHQYPTCLVYLQHSALLDFHLPEERHGI